MASEVLQTQSQKSNKFIPYGVGPEVASKIQDVYRFTKPTPVQKSMFKKFSEGTGASFIVQAGARQGKTLAAVMHSLDTIDYELDKLQVLYVVYEARQAQIISHMFNELTPNRFLKIYRALSGNPLHVDVMTLFRCVNHVVIGTPGRLLDLAERSATDFKSLKFIIIDQVDLLLDSRSSAAKLGDLLRTLPAEPGAVVLTRRLNRDLQELKYRFFGANCAVLTEDSLSNKKNANEEDDEAAPPECVEGDGVAEDLEASFDSTGSDGIVDYNWAILINSIPGGPENIRITDFFEKLHEKLSTFRPRDNVVLKFAKEPVFVERFGSRTSKDEDDAPVSPASGVDSGRGSSAGMAPKENHHQSKENQLLLQYKQALRKAHSTGVDVVFYLLPSGLSSLRPIHDSAENLGIALHGIRTDLLIGNNAVSPDDRLWPQVVRTQAGALFNVFRRRRIVKLRSEARRAVRLANENAKPQKDDANKKTASNRRSGPVVHRERYLRHGTFKVVGPVNVTITIPAMTEAGDSENNKDVVHCIAVPQGVLADVKVDKMETKQAESQGSAGDVPKIVENLVNVQLSPHVVSAPQTTPVKNLNEDLLEKMVQLEIQIGDDVIEATEEAIPLELNVSKSSYAALLEHHPNSNEVPSQSSPKSVYQTPSDQPSVGSAATTESLGGSTESKRSDSHKQCVI